MIRTENWCGHDIRFVEINGEWWAILKDICDALKLRTDGIAQRLSPDMLERVKIEVSNPSSNVDRYEHKEVKRINRDMIGKDIGRHPGENKTRWMLAVNELGIYEALSEIMISPTKDGEDYDWNYLYIDDPDIVNKLISIGLN